MRMWIQYNKINVDIYTKRGEVHYSVSLAYFPCIIHVIELEMSKSRSLG